LKMMVLTFPISTGPGGINTSTMSFLQTSLRSLAAGYVLTYFSEFAFYGQTTNPGLPPASPGELVQLILIYSLMAYLLFSLIEHFQIRSFPALFLTGAAYGWMLEGMVVATLYESMPFSISFTALAWHAPVDVVLGLYWLPHRLAEGKPGKNALYFSTLGLTWGLWVLWPITDLGLIQSPAKFSLFSMIASFPLLPAYWLLGQWSSKPFQPSRWLLIPIGLLLSFSYLFNAVIPFPLGALLLPLLLSLCCWALSRHRRRTPSGWSCSAFTAKPQVLNLLLLLLIPLNASAAYGTFILLGWHMPSHILFGLPGQWLELFIF
jgi:hypothetical protein